MTETATASNEAVYCNNCGTANPRNSVVCCNCGHVHAIYREVTESREPAIVVEQWVWIALRIGCGLMLCLSHVLPTSGATLDAALLGGIFGSIAIPVGIAVVLGNGKWATSSRWFLGAALAMIIMRYFTQVVGSIHFR